MRRGAETDSQIPVRYTDRKEDRRALHAGDSIAEYTGTDLAKITFDIQLLASLGVDPMSEIWRLFDLERQGVTLPLTIGNHGYGRYRWTILSHKTKAEHYDGHGNIISATLSISLQEYLR